MTNSKLEKIKEGREVIYIGAGIITVSVIIIIIGLITLPITNIHWYLGISPFDISLPILIIGVVSFLYGIKTVSSLRKYPDKKKILFLIYFGCSGLLICNIFIMYSYPISLRCIEHWSTLSCSFRRSGLSYALIIIESSLLISSILVLLFGSYHLSKISFVRDVLVEGIERKEKLTQNVVYRIRIEEGNNGQDNFNQVCGSCGEMNRFICTNSELNLFQCKKCKAENYLD
ncbi:hypothetical protein LCGC14_1764600 [marine sediment metagenome]|uniref:Uncharacterized protein n=1 Tax=marine sediment metagenome TaxID=412755 RepID=A0A0F9JZR2_9ZZZZ|nr:hypothetical protein [bacterium]